MDTLFARGRKHFIRIVCCIILTILLVSLSQVRIARAEQEVRPAPGSVAYTDIPADKPLMTCLVYLTNKGIINGFPDGSFRPAESLTRAQAAKLMVLAGKIPVSDAGKYTFRDVGREHWAYREIEAAAGTGLLSGYPDGTFRPDNTITRAEAVTLLINLSKEKLSLGKKYISDVSEDNWAYPYIQTALEAGLVELESDSSFKPDLAMRRGEMARAISAMLTLSPSLRSVELTGVLSVKKGNVTLILGDTAREVTGEIRIGAGSSIITGSDSQAEINFDDGSGILIDENTQLSITRGSGFLYMRKNGTESVGVDKLELRLEKGRIFGGLVSRYEISQQTAFRNEKYITLATTAMPYGLGSLLLAEGEGAEPPAWTDANQEIPWWAMPYTEYERVMVDMPWGMAGIRGTFWMCEVSDKHIVSVATGKGVVRAGGAAVEVKDGQYTEITHKGAQPREQAAMTQELKQLWAEEKNWVLEHMQQMEENLPLPPASAVLPVEMPVEQEPVLQHEVTSGLAYISSVDKFNEVVETATEFSPEASPVDSPAPVSSSGGGRGGSSSGSSTYTVTFESNGGSEVSSIRVTYGSKISAPEVPVRDGYKFTGWYKEAALINLWDFDTDIVTTDITLYAGWEKIQGGNIITFNDAGLEAVVRNELNKPTGDITDVDMAGLEMLFATQSGITDLTGLEYAVNLQTLYLYGNQISDISALASLTELRYLYLYNNEFSDISVLAGLTNLRDLYLNGNQISDITALAGLTDLQVLDLSYNEISDISALDDLTVLQILHLEHNEVSDISALAGLSELYYLDLSDNQISDISALVANNGLGDGDRIYLDNNLLDTNPGSKDMVDIQTLQARGVYVSYNIDTFTVTFDSQGGSEVSSINATYGSKISAPEAPVLDGYRFTGWYKEAELINLWDFNTDTVTADITLYAGWEKQQGGNIITFNDAGLEAAVRNALNKSIGDITDADMASLEELHAYQSGITDLTGLEYAVNLRTLYLGGNQISDITALAGLTGLQVLDLGGNQISDITTLAALTGLQYLYLYINQISDISALASLTALQNLDIGGNQISDISDLAGLTSLQDLSLWGNQISDIAVLAGFTNLQTLILKDNQISDISALVG
ncbi:MAG TPA: leucine-rich repeat domain-containing protein [Bacillota bacterium]|nr:leucine-rich repeat domain-containing protein [Bacillota bacterium]